MGIGRPSNCSGGGGGGSSTELMRRCCVGTVGGGGSADTLIAGRSGEAGALAGDVERGKYREGCTGAGEPGPAEAAGAGDATTGTGTDTGALNGVGEAAAGSDTHDQSSAGWRASSPLGAVERVGGCEQCGGGGGNGGGGGGGRGGGLLVSGAEFGALLQAGGEAEDADLHADGQAEFLEHLPIKIGELL